MLGRLLTYVEAIRGSLWLWPGLFALAALLLARATIGLDRSDWVDAHEIAWLFGSGSVGARTVLATVATAMISIAATVFSVTIVALSLAAGQMGPRLLRTFMRDRATQASLGLFIATFAYCVTVLGVVDATGPEQFVPRASVTTALALSFLSLSVLIYFIHHVAASIQAPSVIRVVGQELELAIARLYPEEVGDDDPERAATEGPASSDRTAPPMAEPGALVRAAQSGYVQFVDGDALVELAHRSDLLIRLKRAPGDFAIAGTALAEVVPAERVTTDLTSQLRDAIACGPVRTPVQDALYLVGQLVEIAQRALSSGINDPTTAEACIDRLGSALGTLLQRRIPSPLRADAEGTLRLVAPRAGFGSFVAAIFDPIRNCDGCNRQVLLRLAALLSELGPLTRHAG